MDIIVCIKRVPETSEAEITIEAGEKDIKKERLTFGINEADNYAVEEAILTKEKYGGTVTLLTVGSKESDEQLRMSLAKGADTAIRLFDEKFLNSDGYAIAKIMSQAIKKLKFDLILTGCMASDDGYMQTGVMLAEMLGIPHAAMVTKVELADKKAKVYRELEGGLLEVLEIELPALLTIQTGINEPRYASFKGIREATKKEIKVLNLSDLELTDEQVGEKGSFTILDKLFIPPVGAKAEILKGSPEEEASQLSTILKEKGLI